MSLANDTWATLRAHLDAVPLERMLSHLVLDAVANPPLPRQCPRYECRSPRVSAPGIYAWQCWTCGAHGGAAALFAASVAGWLDDGAAHGPPDTLASDLPHLLREALCFGFIPVGDGPEVAPWQAIFRHYPEATDYRLRGIYVDTERHQRMRALARFLISKDLPGEAVVDLVTSHNGRKCRPPLDRTELADAINAAAMEAVR